MKIEWAAVVAISIAICICVSCIFGGCDSSKTIRHRESTKILLEIERTKQLKLQLEIENIKASKK